MRTPGLVAVGFAAALVLWLAFPIASAAASPPTSQQPSLDRFDDSAADRGPLATLCDTHSYASPKLEIATEKAK